MHYEFRSAPSCDMCGYPYAKEMGISIDDGVGVWVARCLRCGLIYPDPMPIPADDVEPAQTLAEIDSAAARRLVGSGNKALVIDSEAISRTLRGGGWQVVDGIGGASQGFDLITFGSTLERVLSPAEAIASALPWLRQGGIIHADVPPSRPLREKLQNLLLRLRGTRLVVNLSPMRPPYRLYEFSPRSFQEHGRRAGYDLAGCERRGRRLTVWLRKIV